MTRLRQLGGLVALVLLCFCARAQASSAATGTILLVVDEQAQPLATRVAAELSALGFAVVTQTREPRAPELSVEARKAEAFAAIGIGPTAEGNVEITVLDRVTGKTLRRELLGRSLSDPTTRELVALRASELLRASLMEIEAPHPSRGEVPAPAPASRVARAETARPTDRWLRLATESGVLIAPGLSAAPLLQASIGAKLHDRLDLALTLGSQLTPASRALDTGRIEATARWLELGPRLFLLPRRDDGRVALGVDLQLSLVSLSASGFATDSSHQGQSRRVWSTATTAGIDSKFRLFKQVWWTLRPSAGFAFSELALRADARTVRVWGRPWLQCATGLEVEL